MGDERLQGAVRAALASLEARRLRPDPEHPSGAGEAAEERPLPDRLFPPTAAERLDVLENFVTQEREHRAGMLIRHQDRREYWRRRIADADEALRHIEQLRKELQ
ncbi:MAG: hypothetical protein QM323_11605 [Acidobacteriota bacterium]|nr:hypothetical protein [Acidobacteriota bacterium]